MSVADGTFVTPPGWYPDPADDARLRRWDGQEWTQEVLLAPEQESVVPTPPPTPQPAQPAPSPPPTPPAPNQPPPGQPVPASPAPTVPLPSPPINQNSHPASGPVSIPEWANLPGLTLPPDLSSLPGMQSDSVLHAPTFAETPPETESPSYSQKPAFTQTPASTESPAFAESPQREPPKPPVFEPPYIPQRPDVQDVRRVRTEPTKAEPDVPPPPAAPYAPPPSGVQYDVPPPPGMAHVPSAGPVLPPSAFVAPQLPSTAWPQLPPVSSTPPAALTEPGGANVPGAGPPPTTEVAEGLGTVSSWLIAALPLLQFAVVYLVFGALKVTLAPGMQWGILAVPAAFSLLFANADKKKLTSLGAASPAVILGLIPPLYLIVRCVTTGRSSILPLVAWFVLQTGAAAGTVFLLPGVLATAIHAMGFS